MADILGHSKKDEILKNNTTRTIAVMAIALVITFICMISYFGEGFISGQDMYFHLARLESVYEALKTGQGIKSNIYQSMIYGYGYGAGIFYSDIFFVPFAALRMLTGIGLLSTMKIFIATCIISTCLTSYLAGKNISGDARVGTITMVLYTMGQYHLIDIYVKAALGEVLAMVFVPLVIWGGYELCERKYKNGILCVAFSGLILSHTISTVICIVFLLIWVIIRIRRIVRKKYIFGVMLEAFICLLVTAFYWVPVLEQFFNDEFYVFTRGINSSPSSNVLTITEFYAGYSVSFIECAILLLIIMIGLHEKKYSKKAIGFGIITGLVLIIETGIFPWTLVDKTFFRCIQFPWRLNLLCEFTLAIAIGMQLKALLSDKFEKNTILVIVGSFLLVFFNIAIANMQYNISKVYEDDYMQNCFTSDTAIGGAEWLPDTVNLGEIINSESRGMVITEEGYIDGTYNDDGSYAFTIDDSYSGFVEVPKIYYKGYAANAILKSGEEVLLTVYESERGLVYIQIPENAVSIKVWYNGTLLQNISIYISCITVMLIVLIFVYCRSKKYYINIQETL